MSFDHWRARCQKIRSVNDRAAAMIQSCCRYAIVAAANRYLVPLYPVPCTSYPVPRTLYQVRCTLYHFNQPRPHLELLLTPAESRSPRPTGLRTALYPPFEKPTSTPSRPSDTPPTMKQLQRHAKSM